MATQARFGRLPRSAPSLTSTIVALAQEYQRTRDRNIEDAWENGGEFEGKKVTDQQFLSYWKERLSSVSQDDPMWDYYNNLIHGYEFQIAESKMGLEYARENVSDAEMAAFYTKWANKMPKNSENWRTLMTQAAKFRSAANARRIGNSQRAAADAYQRKQQHTYNTHEAAFDVATKEIAEYAVVAGYLDAEDLDDPDYGWSKLTNAKGENDPANFTALLQDIMASDRATDAITAEIRKYDPTFDGTFTDESLARLGNNARNGAEIRAGRARKAGDTSGANAANAAADKYSKSTMVIRATLGTNKDAGFIEQNETRRAQLDAVLAPDSGATPGERAAALDRYKGWLAGDGMRTLLDSMPRGSTDPASANFNPYIAGLVGRVNNTVNALDGHPTGLTLKDDALGFSTSEAGGESDAVTLGSKAFGLRSSMDLVGTGQAMVVQTDKDGNIDPHGGQWSVFSVGDPALEKHSGNLIPVADASVAATRLSDGSVYGGANGETRYVVASPIKVQTYGAQDPNTGEFTAPAKTPVGVSDEIGTHLVWQGPGGVPVEMWGVWQGGRRIWTTQNPFIGGGKQTTNKDGSITMNFVYPGTVNTKTGKTAQAVPPSTYIDPTTIRQPGEGWNPKTDKQTGWDSPMAAFANSSAVSMERTAGMGDKAVKDAEKSWYSDPQNWTTEMQTKYSDAVKAGADPTQAAVSVVESQSTKLVTTVQFNRAYGYTPEQQQNTRTALQMKADAEAAARMGVSVPTMKARNAQDAEMEERGDLIEQLRDWDIKHTRPQPLYGMGGPRMSQPAASTIPKGWSLKSLLTQPGMSTAQANDIAARITNGEIGQRLPQTVVNYEQAGMFGPTKMTGKRDTANPYMPGKDYRPQQGPPTPIKPKPVQPVTKTDTAINPSTGFTLKTASSTRTSLPTGGVRVVNRDAKGDIISVTENGKTMS